MSEEEKYNDIEQLMYRELSPNRYCYIHNYIIDLKSQLQQKDSIIEEIREYIKDKYDYVLGNDTFLDHDDLVDRKRMQHILEILDKETK